MTKIFTLVMFISLALGLNPSVAQTAPVAGQQAGDQSFSEVYQEYTQLFQEGNFPEALVYAEKAYTLGREQFGPESETAGTLALNLGVVYSNLRKSKEARTFLREALEILKNIYGKDNVKLLDVYMELAVNYSHEGKFGIAETFFKNTLRVAQLEYGEKSLLLLSLRLEMGKETHFQSNTFSRKLYQTAFEFGNKNFPEGHYLTGYAAFELGKIYMGGGAAYRKKAEQYFLETPAVFEKSPPPSLNNILVTHGLLIQLYSEMGREEDATVHCVAVGKIRGDHDLNEYQALYKKVPTYPSSAYNRKQEGVVMIEFIVDAEGKVVNPQVLESTSPSFTKAALKVISEWRYAPRVINGEPIDTHGVKNRFRFLLPE